MLKKLASMLVCLPLILCGCKNSHRIETAAIIENVSVEADGGQIYYTFYLLSDSETPGCVSVPASSFEEARKLAQKEYIPNMSLAKLELLLIRKDVDTDVLKKDIEYISTQASFSPVAYVALCDGKTLEKMKSSADAKEWIERQIILCKNNNPDVNINYLSVFNSYSRGNKKGFRVPLITAEGELKVSVVTIGG